MVSYVLDNATELVRRGHTVVVFAPRPARGIRVDVSHYPFQVNLVPSLPTGVLSDWRITIPYLPKILLDLIRFKIELIHIQDPFFLCTEGIIAAKILKLPIVNTFHSFYMDKGMLDRVYLGRLTSFLQPFLARFTVFHYNLADVVICPSLVAQRELKRSGFKKKSIHVPNGIDLQKIHPVSEKEVRVEKHYFRIPPSSKVALYVGRLTVDKSVDIVLRAWEKVVGKIPSARLLLVGTGSEEKDLKRLISDLELQRSVILAGGMQRDELLKRGIYTIADIFVTASKIENQSYTMLEAIAFGLPLVGVNARGTPELVDDTNGVLVHPDDPDALAKEIISLLLNKKRIHTFKQGSLHKVKRFDLVQTVTQLEQIYSTLL